MKYCCIKVPITRWRSSETARRIPSCASEGEERTSSAACSLLLKSHQGQGRTTTMNSWCRCNMPCPHFSADLVGTHQSTIISLRGSETQEYRIWHKSYDWSGRGGVGLPKRRGCWEAMQWIGDRTQPQCCSNSRSRATAGMASTQEKVHSSVSMIVLTLCHVKSSAITFYGHAIKHFTQYDSEDKPYHTIVILILRDEEKGCNLITKMKPFRF